MTPENWRRVNKIHDEVLEKPSEEWQQFLDKACADDPPEVRDRIEKLLRSPHEDDGGLFNDVRALVAAVLLPERPSAVVPPPQPPEPPPGYKILKLLDSGGMGEVWLVRDLRFKRLLALKVMKVAVSADSHRVRRFVAEARITGRLAHASIVPVHAMGRLADGRRYYTMKFVDGPKLADLLKAQPDVFV
jgi:serine/threonine protein kinase